MTSRPGRETPRYVFGCLAVVILAAAAAATFAIVFLWDVNVP